MFVADPSGCDDAEFEHEANAEPAAELLHVLAPANLPPSRAEGAVRPAVEEDDEKAATKSRLPPLVHGAPLPHPAVAAAAAGRHDVAKRSVAAVAAAATAAVDSPLEMGADPTPPPHECA